MGGILGGGSPAIHFDGGSPLVQKINTGFNRWGGALNPALNLHPNPAMANITNPVTPDAVQGAQTGVGNSLASQNALLAALNAQGNISNQANVFNQGQNAYGNLAGSPDLAGSQGFANTAMGANAASGLLGQMSGAAPATGGLAMQDAALGNNAGAVGSQGAGYGLQNVLQSQAGTLGQYQNIANGTGPNPAQAMLNQQTGQNVANQAALMAGQRGAGANVGLMARQASQQGANTQQQAVGQGATMQAQQQIAALQGLAAQQQAMAGTNQAIGGLGTTQVGQQQAQQQALANMGLGQTGAQQAQYGMNAGIAQNQAANYQNALNQYQSGQLGNQGQVLGAAGQYNANVTAGQGSVNAGNTALSTTSMQGRQGLVGGILNAAGAGIKSGLGSEKSGGDTTGGDTTEGGARGGLVSDTRRMADGGPTDQINNDPGSMTPFQQGPQSSLGQYLAANASNTKNSNNPNNPNSDMSIIATIGSLFAAKGGLANQGGNVNASSPKEKAVKAGNSYANDKVPALLSEGEVVIPRSVMQSKDPARSAADFVSKVMAKRRIGK